MRLLNLLGNRFFLGAKKPQLSISRCIPPMHPTNAQNLPNYPKSKMRISGDRYCRPIERPNRNVIPTPRAKVKLREINRAVSDNSCSWQNESTNSTVNLKMKPIMKQPKICPMSMPQDYPLRMGFLGIKQEMEIMG